MYSIDTYFPMNMNPYEYESGHQFWNPLSELATAIDSIQRPIPASHQTKTVLKNHVEGE